MSWYEALIAAMVVGLFTFPFIVIGIFVCGSIGEWMRRHHMLFDRPWRKKK